jgi:hypothetical protein
MFTEYLGCAVAGSFDTGSAQRPKLECTKESSPIEDGVAESDVMLLHQCEDYSNVFERYAQARSGIGPVVLNLFGQGCLEQHQHTVQTLRECSNAYAVAYSHKDAGVLMQLGAPREKVAMIRFGKVMDDFREHGGWTGHLPVCYMSCNAIKRRGDGCSWPLAEELLLTDLPLIVSGRETLELDRGIGELSYEGLRSMYRQCRCYLSLGTKPAPLVLTLIEAMCTGTPVIAYDNGCGIVGEQLDGVLIARNVHEITMAVEYLVEHPEKAINNSAVCRYTAEQEFSMDIVADRWSAMLDHMLSRRA